MQIKGKLSIKRRRDKKISHFWSPKESSYGSERRREKGRREKKEEKRREEEEKRRRRAKRVWNSKVLYGFVWFSMDYSMELV